MADTIGPPGRPAGGRGRARHSQHVEGKELSAYLDAALAPRRLGSIERHLAACDQCRRELAALRVAKAAIGGLGEAEPDPAWLPGVTTLLTSGAPPRRSQRARRARRRAAVALVGIAGLGLGILLAPPPPAPISFQQEVRQHLVLIDEPSADQASYLVEAGHP